MSRFSSSTVWVIRIGDGVNFKNSIKYSIWGLKKCWLSSVDKFKRGDLLCFISPKKSGGSIIGIGEFVESYNREEEPLIQINTKTNEELGWIGRDANEDWNIQIKYKNLVNTSGKKFMRMLVQSPRTILCYDTLSREKHTLPDGDIREHYANFLKYGIKY